jgi:type II secretory pathway component PulF
MSPSAIVFTPGQFTRRAELYHQFAQLTVAGLPILKALEQLERHPPSRAFREPLRLMLHEIAGGFTFSEALSRSGKWVSPLDLALVDAGERSGRLDASFRTLADLYSERARMTKQMLSDLAYPVFLLHFAVLIFAFIRYVSTWNLTPALVLLAGVLLPVYAMAALLIYVSQSKHGEGWRSTYERLLHFVPILGSGRRDLALARLSMALEALINAGVTIIEAWELAATVSGSPALRRAVHNFLPDLRAGQTPAEAVTACGVFPDLFTNQYNSGEVSGKLDETLRQLHRYYQEEGARKIQTVSQWTPRLIYLIIALAIAYYIVNFWMNYFQQIGNATSGF